MKQMKNVRFTHDWEAVVGEDVLFHYSDENFDAIDHFDFERKNSLDVLLYYLKRQGTRKRAAFTERRMGKNPNQRFNFKTENVVFFSLIISF